MDAFYTSWVDEVLLATFLTDNFSVLLLSNQYVPDINTHTARADIAVASIIAEANLQNITVSQGAVDFDDVVFPGVVASNPTIESVVTMNNTKDKIVAIHQNVTGISIAPNGNDLMLSLDPCGWFGV